MRLRGSMGRASVNCPSPTADPNLDPNAHGHERTETDKSVRIMPFLPASWTSIDSRRQAGEKVRFLGGLGVLRGIYPSF